MATNGDDPRELFLIDGNSLAYRAFFALPESIATSDGRPTNAIFGFASMLVKILTDYGPRADGRGLGRRACPGARRSRPTTRPSARSRPDLLKLQWPHLRPLVEAFGYRNISVEGYEADDVIAALTEQAKRARDPGDGRHRRPRRLPARRRRRADHDARQRGVTDTKVYDRQGVIDRYGIPPELVPDFIGLKGDTSDNIPGVPGIGDKTAADLLQRFGDLERRAGQRRRDLRRQAQAEPDRARRRRAHVQAARDDGPRRPDRHRPRGRDRRASPTAPACARCSATGSCATRCAGSRRRSTRPRWRRSRGPRRPRRARSPAREGTPADIADAARRRAGARRRPRPSRPRASCCRARDGLALRAPTRAATHALAGEVDDPAELVAAAGDRPVIAHDAKALGEVPANLVFDTEVAAYLLDPARRGYPLDELAEERGMAVDGRRPAGRARRARRTSSPPASASRSRERGLEDLLTRDRAAARARAARDREGRHQARHAAARGGPPRASAPTPPSSSARSGSSRARSS